MAKYDYADLPHIARVGLALSDSSRLRILMALRGQTMCVCQLRELLGLAPSTVSKHLSVLKDAELITEKKIGRWVYHELCCTDCSCFPVLEWLRQKLSRDEQILADKKRLKEIMSVSAETWC